MDTKFTRRYENFQKSLKALTEAKDRDPSDSFVLSGTAAKFTITYELAWKVMEDIVIQYYGISDFIVGAPKDVLRKAFQVELISEEDGWMEMHELRNQIAHTYDESELEEIYHLIVDRYLDSMYRLRDRIAILPIWKENESE